MRTDLIGQSELFTFVNSSDAQNSTSPEGAPGSIDTDECKKSPSSRHKRSRRSDSLFNGIVFNDYTAQSEKQTHYKRSSVAVSEILLSSDDPSDHQDGYAMKRCQNQVTVTHDGTIIGARCRHRLCPLCQWRRSVDVFRETVDVMTETQVIKPYRYYSLTLTVENCLYKDTKPTIKEMHKAFSRLMNYREVKAGISGYVRMTEISEEQNREEYANPHMHVLICVNSGFHRSNYISAKRWSTLWRKATKNPKLTAVTNRAWKPLLSSIDGSFDLRPHEVASSIVYGIKPYDFINKHGEIRNETPSSKFILAMNHQLRNIARISHGGVFKTEFTRHRAEIKERDALLKEQRKSEPKAEIMGNPTKYRESSSSVHFDWIPNRWIYVEEGFEHKSKCSILDNTDYQRMIEHQNLDPVRYGSSVRCNESIRSRPSISPPITSQCPPPTVPIPKSDPCVKIPDNSKDIIPSTDEGVKASLSQPKSSIRPCSNSANDECDEGITFLSTQGTCEGIPEGVDITDGEPCVGRPKPEPFDVLKASDTIHQRRMESIRRMMKRQRALSK